MTAMILQLHLEIDADPNDEALKFALQNVTLDQARQALADAGHPSTKYQATWDEPFHYGAEGQPERS